MESNINENEEEEIDEVEDWEQEGRMKNVSSRSARGMLNSKGLRVLSVRVHEIVREKKQSTYKEVADDLINELAITGRLDNENFKQGKESVILK